MFLQFLCGIRCMPNNCQYSMSICHFSWIQILSKTLWKRNLGSEDRIIRLSYFYTCRFLFQYYLSYKYRTSTTGPSLFVNLISVEPKPHLSLVITSPKPRSPQTASPTYHGYHLKAQNIRTHYSIDRFLLFKWCRINAHLLPFIYPLGLHNPQH